MNLEEGFVRQHERLFATLTWLADLLVPVATFYVSYWVVFGIELKPESYISALVCSVGVSAVYFPFLSLYRTRRGESLLAELRMVSIAVFLLFVTLSLVAVMAGDIESYSRSWFFIWFCMTLLLMSCARFMLRVLLRILRSSGYNQRHIVIVGEPVLCQEVKDTLVHQAWTGLNVLEVFDGEIDGISRDLQQFLDYRYVDQVWLAMPLRSEAALHRLSKQLARYVVDVRYVPDSRGAILLGKSIEQVAGLPVMNLSETPIDGFNRFLKEVEDRLLALVFLLILSPLMVVVATGVKLSSPGPIFYRQERLGVSSRSIRMFKFRTMPVDTESRSGPVWNKKGEVRATPFGHFLRSTSLDELPQLFNVLIGEMSIVGPRPERPMFVEQFKHEIPGYMQKHRVKAGITGWAQINGWRGDTDLNKRIEHDLYYIQHWSLLFDFKIILLTITRGLIHKNAG